jgi:hypothetical protein
MIGKRSLTILSLVGATMMMVTALGPYHAIAQGKGAPPGYLVVGTMDMPPFLIKAGDGDAHQQSSARTD